jgi:hypothetical protein
VSDFAVTSDALMGARQAVMRAGDHLEPATRVGRDTEAAASEVHYQRAAARMEAVAQKAASSLRYIWTALSGLSEGLGRAATGYRGSDEIAANAFGGDAANQPKPSPSVEHQPR